MTSNTLRLAAALAVTVVALPAVLAVQPIAVNGVPIQGVLEPSDLEPIVASCARSDPSYYRDVYSFEGAPGTMIEIHLASQFDGFLYLYDPSQIELALNDDGPDMRNSRISQTINAAGTHYIIVSSFSGGTTGAYSLTASSVAVDPPSAVDSPISPGFSVEGTLVAGDAVPLPDYNRGAPTYNRDGHAFHGEAGQQATINLTCSFDGYLFLVDPSGAIVARNDDHGSVSASQIVHTLTSAGTHRAVVTSYNDGGTGRYTISLALTGGGTSAPTTAPTLAPTSAPTSAPTPAPKRAHQR